MKKITLDHGGGGAASGELIKNLFLKHLRDPVLGRLEDSAVLSMPPGRLAFTTDGYVVDPIFFPGGDIGELAVNGTINDLAVRGAEPLYLSLALILEEGLYIPDLERVIISIAKASERAGVPVVTGDTKVTPRGKADKIFITTSGVGVLDENIGEITAARIKPGDAVLLSGTIADHGVTILTQRAGLEVGGDIESDSMALHGLTKAMLAACSNTKIHAMRDPTRGGVAATLNELAEACGLGMEIDESAVPIRTQTRAACELLGLDPLHLANEGKCIAIVEPGVADDLLAVMRARPEGANSSIIGRVGAQYPGKVVLRTIAGGKRMVEPASGVPLPRIC